MGGRLPLAATGIGIALLAHAPAVLDRRGRPLGALSLVAPLEAQSHVAARLALRTASLAVARAAEAMVAPSGT